jgi:hypothetical protein
MILSPPLSLRPLRSTGNCLLRLLFTRSQATLLLLLGVAALGFAQDSQPVPANSNGPVKRIHVMNRSSILPDSDEVRRAFTPRTAVRPNIRPLNSGSGIQYTCDPSVTAATCDYLNTTVAGYYNSTFTNANASIYITFGSTGLGQSSGYDNYVTYDQYVSALNSNTNKSGVQTAALSALNTYDATPYGSNYVEITIALATALGLGPDAANGGLTGTTANGVACTPGAQGCYNAVIVVSDTPDTFYYDNLGGTEPADEFDFYGVVQHETDEVLGTSSCITTQGPSLSDGCDSGAPAGTGTPSAVDLFRYSSAGELVLDSSVSTTPGAYFSFNGGSTNGAKGVGGTPKVYNTLNNGDDYADYLSSTPDCGTDEAIQDAEGCPGEDMGLTILNDGKSEITILNAVGFDVPGGATMTSPAPGSKLTGPSATFTWTPVGGANSYVLWLGTTGVGSNNLWSSGSTTATSVMFGALPTNGATIYARLWTLYGSVTLFTDYTYTAVSPATLSSPAGGSTFNNLSETFQWSPITGATRYDLWLGTTGVGSNNLWSSGSTGATSVTFGGLPANGEKIYARLWTFFTGGSAYTDTTYTVATAAELTSNGTITGTSKMFTWTAATGASRFSIWVGSSVGSNNLGFTEGGTTSTSFTVNGLPTDGSTIHVRLWTVYPGGGLAFIDYTFTAS